MTSKKWDNNNVTISGMCSAFGKNSIKEFQNNNWNWKLGIIHECGFVDVGLVPLQAVKARIGFGLVENRK